MSIAELEEIAAKYTTYIAQKMREAIEKKRSGNDTEDLR